MSASHSQGVPGAGVVPGSQLCLRDGLLLGLPSLPVRLAGPGRGRLRHPRAAGSGFSNTGPEGPSPYPVSLEGFPVPLCRRQRPLLLKNEVEESCHFRMPAVCWARK